MDGIAALTGRRIELNGPLIHVWGGRPRPPFHGARSFIIFCFTHSMVRKYTGIGELTGQRLTIYSGSRRIVVDDDSPSISYDQEKEAIMSNISEIRGRQVLDS